MGCTRKHTGTTSDRPPFFAARCWSLLSTTGWLPCPLASVSLSSISQPLRYVITHGRTPPPLDELGCSENLGQVSNDNYDYLQTLHVLRSSGNIAVEVGTFLLRSQFYSFCLSRQDLVPFSLDSETRQAVASLESLPYPPDTSARTRDACQSAIQALQEWIVECNGHPRTWRDFIAWPQAVVEEYLSLLREQHPVALVIFAHWCAIMHRAPRRWFMDRWAARAFSSLTEFLGAEWDDAMRWPKAQIQREPTRYKLYNLCAGEQFSSLIRAGADEEFD
jgi:hypothetical protein